MKETCACRMDSKKKVASLRKLLRDYGDKPPSEIPKEVRKETLKNFETICDCKGNVIAAVKQEQTDWYLWTLMDLATHGEHRKKGYGTEVTMRAINKAVKSGAKVIAADITFDNKPSKKIFKKLGFKQVNRFCWAKGKKPADILHFVLIPPTGTKCPK